MQVARKILTVMVALMVVLGSITVSEAALTAVSPNLNAFSFPMWYQDAAGTRLQDCLVRDNPPGASPCVMLDAPPFFTNTLPLTFGPPVNFPPESFYFFAGARIPQVGPQAIGGTVQRNVDLRIVVEAAFGGPNGDPINGEQVTFSRINLQGISGGPNCGIAPINPLDCVLQPGATYTVTHPYGVFTFVADANGEAISGPPNGQAHREVTGCPAPPFPCDFTAALPAPFIGPNFLRAVAPPPPAGFIGNAAVLQTVTPGPFGNFFRIDGPNIGGPGINTIQVADWTLAGQLTLGPAAAIVAGNFDGDVQGVQTLAAIDTLGSIWVSTGAAFVWRDLGLPPAPATTYTKIVAGDFNTARLGDELAAVTADGRVFIFNDMLTPTPLAVAAPLGTLVTDLVAGDFDPVRPGQEIVGLLNTGPIMIPSVIGTTITGLVPAAGTGKAAKIVAFNFNGVPPTDLAVIGLGVNGKVWISTDVGATWTNVPGALASIIKGDFDGDGLDDLAGINKSGKMWWNALTAPLSSSPWIQIQGALSQLTSGNFNVLRAGDELAGANASGKLWKAMNNMPVVSTDWTLMSGAGKTLIRLNFEATAGDEFGMLDAAGTIWTSHDGAIWTRRN